MYIPGEFVLILLLGIIAKLFWKKRLASYKPKRYGTAPRALRKLVEGGHSFEQGPKNLSPESFAMEEIIAKKTPPVPVGAVGACVAVKTYDKYKK